MVHDYAALVFWGVLGSDLVTGAFFGLFLIPIHLNDHAQIHSQQNERLGFVELLQSTPNFSTGNKLLTFLLGGFNHHACHHLFPSISHIHYPSITRILRKVSSTEGVVYNDLTFWQLIKSHFKHLKKLATS